jgi:hypothetical protein
MATDSEVSLTRKRSESEATSHLPIDHAVSGAAFRLISLFVQHTEIESVEGFVRVSAARYIPLRSRMLAVVRGDSRAAPLVTPVQPILFAIVADELLGGYYFTPS